MQLSLAAASLPLFSEPNAPKMDSRWVNQQAFLSELDKCANKATRSSMDRITQLVLKDEKMCYKLVCAHMEKQLKKATKPSKRMNVLYALSDILRKSKKHPGSKQFIAKRLATMLPDFFKPFRDCSTEDREHLHKVLKLWQKDAILSSSKLKEVRNLVGDVKAAGTSSRRARAPASPADMGGSPGGSFSPSEPSAGSGMQAENGGGFPEEDGTQPTQNEPFMSQLPDESLPGPPPLPPSYPQPPTSPAAPPTRLRTGFSSGPLDPAPYTKPGGFTPPPQPAPDTDPLPPPGGFPPPPPLPPLPLTQPPPASDMYDPFSADSYADSGGVTAALPLPFAPNRRPMATSLPPSVMNRGDEQRSTEVASGEGGNADAGARPARKRRWGPPHEPAAVQAQLAQSQSLSQHGMGQQGLSQQPGSGEGGGPDRQQAENRDTQQAGQKLVHTEGQDVRARPKVNGADVRVLADRMLWPGSAQQGQGSMEGSLEQQPSSGQDPRGESRGASLGSNFRGPMPSMIGLNLSAQGDGQEHRQPPSNQLPPPPGQAGWDQPPPGPLDGPPMDNSHPPLGMPGPHSQFGGPPPGMAPQHSDGFPEASWRPPSPHGLNPPPAHIGLGPGGLGPQGFEPPLGFGTPAGPSPGFNQLGGGPGFDMQMGPPGFDMQRGSGLGLDSQRASGPLGFEPPRGGPGFEPPRGGPGFEPPRGGPGFEPPRGGPGFELPRGGPGFDPPRGGPGFEPSRGGPGFDQRGGPGFDPQRGGPGFDLPRGGPGFDPPRGAPGFEPQRGGPGFDPPRGGSGFEPQRGGPGFDMQRGPPGGFNPHMGPGGGMPQQMNQSMNRLLGPGGQRQHGMMSHNINPQMNPQMGSRFNPDLPLGFNPQMSHSGLNPNMGGPPGLGNPNMGGIGMNLQVGGPGGIDSQMGQGGVNSQMGPGLHPQHGMMGGGSNPSPMGMRGQGMGQQFSSDVPPMSQLGMNPQGMNGPPGGFSQGLNRNPQMINSANIMNPRMGEVTPPGLRMPMNNMGPGGGANQHGPNGGANQHAHPNGNFHQHGHPNGGINQQGMGSSRLSLPLQHGPRTPMNQGRGFGLPRMPPMTAPDSPGMIPPPPPPPLPPVIPPPPPPIEETPPPPPPPAQPAPPFTPPVTSSSDGDHRSGAEQHDRPGKKPKLIDLTTADDFNLQESEAAGNASKWTVVMEPKGQHADFDGLPPPPPLPPTPVDGDIAPPLSFEMPAAPKVLFKLPKKQEVPVRKLGVRQVVNVPREGDGGDQPQGQKDSDHTLKAPDSADTSRHGVQVPGDTAPIVSGVAEAPVRSDGGHTEQTLAILQVVSHDSAELPVAGHKDGPNGGKELVVEHSLLGKQATEEVPAVFGAGAESDEGSDKSKGTVRTAPVDAGPSVDMLEPVAHGNGNMATLNVEHAAGGEKQELHSGVEVGGAQLEGAQLEAKGEDQKEGRATGTMLEHAGGAEAREGGPEAEVAGTGQSKAGVVQSEVQPDADEVQIGSVVGESMQKPELEGDELETLVVNGATVAETVSEGDKHDRPAAEHEVEE